MASATTKTVAMTDETRNAALATIFGTDAIRAANILLLGGEQSWTDMATAVGAGGAAADMAAAQNKGLGGAIDGLRSVIETTLLTAAGPLLESLAGIVRWVGDLVGKFAAANPQLLTAGIAFAGVLAVAAPLALGIGVIASTLGALLAPIGLVVLAVGALAAAWTTNFGNIQGIVASAVTTIQGIFSQLQTFITENSAAIMGPINAAWTGIQTLVTGVVNGVWTLVSAIFGQLETFLAAHGDQIKSFIITAWTAIGAIVNTTIAILNATIIPALTAIAGFIRTHGEEIQAVFSAVWAADLRYHQHRTHGDSRHPEGYPPGDSWRLERRLGDAEGDRRGNLGDDQKHDPNHCHRTRADPGGDLGEHQGGGGAGVGECQGRRGARLGERQGGHQTED